MSSSSPFDQLERKNPKIRRYEDKRREFVYLLTEGLQKLKNNFLQGVNEQLDQLVIRVKQMEEEQQELLKEKDEALASANDEISRLRQTLSGFEAKSASKSKEVDGVKRPPDEKTSVVQLHKARPTADFEANLHVTETVTRCREYSSTSQSSEAVKDIFQRDEQLKQLEEALRVKDRELTQKNNELAKCILQLQINKNVAHATKIRQLEKLKPSSEIQRMMKQLQEEKRAVMTCIQEFNSARQMSDFQIKSMMEKVMADTGAVLRYIRESNSDRKFSNDCSSTYAPEKKVQQKSSLPAHLQRLQQVKHLVVNKLEAHKVAGLMFQSDALTFGELESVVLSKTSFEAATRLVELVLNESEEEVYFCFLKALEMSEQQHIWTLLSFADQNIDDEHVKLIRTHYSYLVKNLDLRDTLVLSKLYAEEVLDQTDKEDLECEPVNSRRVRELLLMLSKKSAKKFDVFLDVLKTTQQEHIVSQLRGTSSEKSGSPSGTHVIPADGDRGVAGVTSVNNQLFVLREPSRQEIEVYDTKTFTFHRKLRVSGLSDKYSNSLTSCTINNCLYVGDWYSKTVNKVELTRGDKLSTWKVDSSPSGLSVNIACNVLVTCRDDNKILEYTTGGQLIREIKIKKNNHHDDEALSPLHSIELTDGRFVVCRWSPLPGDVIVVDNEGRVVDSYINRQFTGQPMKYPMHLAVDKNDCILVADTDNNRVVMLNSSLSCARDLPVTVYGGLNRPQCLHYDESRGRLLIGEYDGKKRVIVINNI